MKSVNGFASLLGFVLLGIFAVRLLNSGAVQRTKDGTTFRHDAALEAVWDTVKPFEENIDDLTNKRRK